MTLRMFGSEKQRLDTAKREALETISKMMGEMPDDFTGKFRYSTRLYGVTVEINIEIEP